MDQKEKMIICECCYEHFLTPLFTFTGQSKFLISKYSDLQ